MVMAKPVHKWTKRVPKDGFWYHRQSVREWPQLLRVYKREVFMCFPEDHSPVATFGGEWWSEEQLPSPACIAYLGDGATPENIGKTARWPGDRKKSRR
jgi:hypothetical protein